MMGDLTRIERAGRFQEAFGDLVDNVARPGNYTVTGPAIGYDDSGRVGVYLNLKENGGDEHEVMVCGTEFDLEAASVSLNAQADLVEYISELFCIDPSEAEDRLRKANLI